ncbi:MAG TPA: hypothetical protein VFB15_10720 [Candidatus Binataceae bacterium]|nr:hypothetical protein [Candidatus Binataceae bacterium]
MAVDYVGRLSWRETGRIRTILILTLTAAFERRLLKNWNKAPVVASRDILQDAVAARVRSGASDGISATVASLTVFSFFFESNARELADALPLTTQNPDLHCFLRHQHEDLRFGVSHAEVGQFSIGDPGQFRIGAGNGRRGRPGLTTG